MRVIAGRFRGRRLKAPHGRGVRPTSDRVREAVFGILGEAVEGARVLDLYAGTGALALEALSRGAVSATCVERDPAALALLEANVAGLGLEGQVRIVRADATGFARGAEEEWELVFCDPPYAEELDDVGRHVVAGAVWTRACVLEHAARTEPPPAPAGARADTRRYGDTAVTLYWRDR
jgi:16S rRNA (guanine(966)-N(2))-methyltransferase RsmD